MFHALFVNLSGLITIVINKNLIIKTEASKTQTKQHTTPQQTTTKHKQKLYIPETTPQYQQLKDKTKPVKKQNVN